MVEEKISLKKTVGLLALILYGTGNILGAGIYGLIGKVVGTMGNGAWLAFLMSMIAAGLTGLSYASVGSRYPRAGGAVYASARAFRSNFLSYTVGFMVMMSGFLSMATATRIFSGYLGSMLPNVPPALIIISFGLLVTALVYRGLKESLWFNAVCTTIELGGLIFVIVVGIPYLGNVSYLDFKSPVNPGGEIGLGIILAGAILTFYSFIGFEDILNISEEVKEPKKTVPRGLIIAIVCSSIIYVLVSLVAVSVISVEDLAVSKQPMADVVAQAASWMPPQVFNFIALFAVSNTVLLNLITTSRLIFGMARQGQLPKVLETIHPKRQNPHWAIILSGGVLLTLALLGDITSLAKATSVMLLCSFIVVNASLIILKKKDKIDGTFEVPIFVPALGMIFCAILLFQAERTAWLIALAIFAVIGVAYAILRPKVDPSTFEELES